MSLGVGSAGCRDQDYSGEPYPENLGDGDRVLMPVPVHGYTSKPRFEGSAELRPLAQITADAAPGGGNDPSPLVAQVRELIATYNDIVEKEAYEELPAYYVERQKETVSKLVEAREQFMAKIDELAGVVQDKAPESAASVAKLRDMIGLFDFELPEVTNLELVSETEVIGRLFLPEGVPTTLGMDGLSLRFVFLDEEWYIEYPLLDSMALMLPTTIPQAISSLDTMIAGIKSGQMDAATVAQQLQTFSAMLGGGQQRAEEPSDAHQGHDDKSPDEGGGGP